MSSPAPATPDTIQLFDKYGREFQITREQWRTEVLPKNIQSHWNDADALYGDVLQAIQDGFAAEAADGLARLAELEPASARSMTARGFVMMQEGRLDEAQRLLEEATAKHPDDAATWNNLAKVYDRRGDAKRVEATLWRALQADPNMENSLGWYEAIARESGGANAAAEALQRVTQLPNSWRARTALARHRLDARDLEGASKLHREALDMVRGQVPADILMTITGDLGRRGYLKNLLEIGTEHFDIDRHGMTVANNLIKAYLDTGQSKQARALVERLFAFNRPDWKPTLSHWDSEILKAEAARNAPVGDKVEMAMYVIEGPVWAHPQSPVARLFPPPPKDAPLVVFIGSTAETPNAPATPQVQLADQAGRLSRILPLYLAERAQMQCGARVRGLFPWMDNALGGSFIVTTTPVPDDAALQRARSGANADFVVVTHVDAKSDVLTGIMRVLRASDGKCVFEHRVNATHDRPDVIAAALSIEVQKALRQYAGLGEYTAPGYLPPAPPHLVSYLLRLEQLLALRCARSPEALHGVREILDGNLHLALDFPQSVAIRALLADVVARMRNIRPDVIAQYSEALRMLQDENPLPEPAQSILAGMIDGAIAGQGATG